VQVRIAGQLREQRLNFRRAPRRHVKLYRASSPEPAENRALAASLVYPASESGENAPERAGE
jgi:hypothetical protein